VVVAVVDDVGGGCAGVVNSDVVASRGGLDGLTKVWVAVSVVLGVVWTLRSTWGVVSAFFVKVGLSSSGGSVWRAAHRRSGVPLVWKVVSAVVGAAWVLALTVVVIAGVVWVSTLVVVTASVWVSASSRMTAPRKSAHAWATIDRQSPVPCPSVSHFRCSWSFPSCIPSS
jgi:hypothetical protein